MSSGRKAGEKKAPRITSENAQACSTCSPETLAVRQFSGRARAGCSSSKAALYKITVWDAGDETGTTGGKFCALVKPYGFWIFARVASSFINVISRSYHPASSATANLTNS